MAVSQPPPPPLSLPPPHPLAHLQLSLTHAQHNLPPLTDDELSRKPRPHPHLNTSTLYLDHVPPSLSESDLAKALKECMPVRIKLFHPVPPHARMQPNAFYEWMPRSGTLVFDNMYHVEKALAMLAHHPSLLTTGVAISTYPHQPLPLPSSVGRYIRPTVLVHPPQLLNGAASNPELAFLQTCPTSGEVFDRLRVWGSVRSVNVFAEGPEGECPTTWGARVEFWFEDEARRFDIGFGQIGGHIKGWQVSIFAEPPLAHLNTPFATGPAMPMIFPSAPPNLPKNGPLTPAPWCSRGPPVPLAHPGLGMPWVPANIANNGLITPPSSGTLVATIPSTAPMSYTPPWAQHHPFTISGTDRPLDVPITPSFRHDFSVHSTPSSRRGSAAHARHRSNSSRASLGSYKGHRPRTWSLTVDHSPDGTIRPTGLIGDDGTVIQHGPGQHIRPAPLFGPGSTSSSGLVDYSNVFVKNLDPDVNSDFLSDFFSAVGNIVSARVMRDDKQRSRGYGFVSFETPEQAAAAIRIMNGQTLGAQTIAVTLHEPRLLRTEKLAARRTKAGPTPFGRDDSLHSSTSRTSATGSSHSKSSGDQLSGGTDEIRSLSPQERKSSLTRRVTPLVNKYAEAMELPAVLRPKVINALVAHDLALIPLLHDIPALQARIAETVAIIQEESDLNLDASTNDEVVTVNVDLTGEEDSSLTLAGPVPEPISPPGPAAFKSPTNVLVTSPPAPLPLLTSKEILTIPQLAGLPTARILALVSGGEGRELMARLDLRQPSALEINSNGVSPGTLSNKGIVEQKMDLAGILAKKIGGNVKKSTKLKLAGEVVNKEQDLEALCALLPYTDIIQAKIEHYRSKGKT